IVAKRGNDHPSRDAPELLPRARTPLLRLLRRQPHLGQRADGSLASAAILLGGTTRGLTRRGGIRPLRHVGEKPSSLLACIGEREDADVADVETPGLPGESIAEPVAARARCRDPEEKPAKDRVVIFGLPSSDRQRCDALVSQVLLRHPGLPVRIPPSPPGYSRISSTAADSGALDPELKLT